MALPFLLFCYVLPALVEAGSRPLRSLRRPRSSLVESQAIEQSPSFRASTAHSNGRDMNPALLEDRSDLPKGYMCKHVEDVCPQATRQVVIRPKDIFLASKIEELQHDLQEVLASNYMNWPYFSPDDYDVRSRFNVAQGFIRANSSQDTQALKQSVTHPDNSVVPMLFSAAFEGNIGEWTMKTIAGIHAMVNKDPNLVGDWKSFILPVYNSEDFAMPEFVSAGLKAYFDNDAIRLADIAREDRCFKHVLFCHFQDAPRDIVKEMARTVATYWNPPRQSGPLQVGFILRNGLPRHIIEVNSFIEQCNRCKVVQEVAQGTFDPVDVSQVIGDIQCRAFDYSWQFKENLKLAASYDLMIGPHGSHTWQGLYKMPNPPGRPSCLVELMTNQAPQWAWDNINGFASKTQPGCVKVLMGEARPSESIAQLGVRQDQLKDSPLESYRRDFDVSFQWPALQQALQEIFGGHLVCS